MKKWNERAVTIFDAKLAVDGPKAAERGHHHLIARQPTDGSEKKKHARP